MQSPGFHSHTLKLNIKKGTGSLSPCERLELGTGKVQHKGTPPPRHPLVKSSLSPVIFQNHLHQSSETLVKEQTPGLGAQLCGRTLAWHKGLSSIPRVGGFPRVGRYIRLSSLKTARSFRKLWLEQASQRRHSPSHWSGNCIFLWEWRVSSHTTSSLTRVDADGIWLAHLKGFLKQSKRAFQIW